MRANIMKTSRPSINRIKKKTFQPIGLTMLALILSCGLAQAQVIIAADTFTLNGTTRVSGASLNTIAVETGTGSWSTITDTRFSSSGTIVASINNANSSVSTLGEIAFTNPNPTGILSVQADLVTSTSQWGGIGFQTSASPSQTNWFSTSNLLWVYLTKSGGWYIYSGGLTTQVATGVISSYSSTTPYTLTLSYDPGTNMVDLLINGTDVSGWKSVTLGGSIGSAGFIDYATATAGASSVDNFQLSVVPEPGSLALTLLGGMSVMVFVLRREKNGAIVRQLQGHQA